MMNKLVTATIVGLGVSSVGFISHHADAAENNQVAPQQTQQAQQTADQTKGYSYGSYFTKDTQGNYHHTLDGNWDQSIFDNKEYQFTIVDEAGATHYFYFPQSLLNPSYQYDDNNYSANASNSDVQANGYDVNEAPSAEDIANNPNKASENNATYNNNTSNAQYENTYNQSQDNTTYAPAQNATSDAGTAQNVEATQAPAPQTTQANAAAQGQQGGGSTQGSDQAAQTSGDSAPSNQADGATAQDAGWLTKHPKIQPYGQYHGGGAHYGVDYGMPENTPVYSLTDGTVTQAGWSNYGGGNQVTIQEKNSNNYQWYMHMNSLNVQQGQDVSAGDQIGLSGSTGNSTAPHLHFQRMQGGVGNQYSVNPDSYINSRA
ncbi:M23 family metallopeptidase [Staphylococcus simulans]|uniref:M23 family metallopeptidase n=1 Tax=Staphylococcus simulans TaxID=1286 RepID=UPI003CC80FFC